MHVKLKTLVNEQFQMSFQKLRRHNDLKASVSWKLLASSKKIVEYLDNYEKIRIQLCEKHARKDQEGNPVIIDVYQNGIKQFVFEPEVVPGLNSEMETLISEEVSLPDPTVKVTDLGDIQLNVTDLEQLVGVVLVAE